MAGRMRLITARNSEFARNPASRAVHTSAWRQPSRRTSHSSLRLTEAMPGGGTCIFQRSGMLRAE